MGKLRPVRPEQREGEQHQRDDWAVAATALTSQIWLIKQDAKGEWQARAVADIGDPSKIPLPVDISIAANGKGLWVNTFMDGKTRYFDLSDPEHPKQTYEKATGKQVNMVSQSWDGKRVYITSSLLANWDTRPVRTTSSSCAPSTGTARRYPGVRDRLYKESRTPTT
jgi:selenium-binding protein 1